MFMISLREVKQMLVSTITEERKETETGEDFPSSD